MKTTALLLFATASALAAEFAPIVEFDTGYLFGATEKSKPVTAARTAKRLRGNETYRLYSLTGTLGDAKGGKPANDVEVCGDVFTIKLTAKTTDAVIAIGGKWNALPRTPRLAATTQPAYVAAMKTFLESRGLRDPAVKIDQVVRIDLDGDGEDEVLVSATNYFSKDGVPSESPKGSYSCVIERRVVKGEVRTRLIAGEFYPKSKDFNAPSQYEVSAVLDVDGDGVMEVIVSSNYYEGGATTIYRCDPAKITELLAVACGV